MIRIDEKSFQSIVEYMKQSYGLDLSKKKVLIECRLTKVLQNLNIPSFEAYVKMLNQDHSGQLIEQMVDINNTLYVFFKGKRAFSIIKEQSFTRICGKEKECSL